MDNSSIASRLRMIIDSLGLSDSQFADTCSITRPTLSLLLSGKNKKISDVLLGQIHKSFPSISILWLLFGEGEMMVKENKEPEPGNPDEILKNTTFDQDSTEQLNLINVSQLENIVQNVVDKSFKSNEINIEKILQKNNPEISPRKVSKITIYYDDSTFETFSPD